MDYSLWARSRPCIASDYRAMGSLDSDLRIFDVARAQRCQRCLHRPSKGSDRGPAPQAVHEQRVPSSTASRLVACSCRMVFIFLAAFRLPNRIQISCFLAYTSSTPRVFHGSHWVGPCDFGSAIAAKRLSICSMVTYVFRAAILMNGHRRIKDYFALSDIWRATPM